MESCELTRSVLGRFCALWIKELLDRHVAGFDLPVCPLAYGEELDFFCAWN